MRLPELLLAALLLTAACAQAAEPPAHPPSAGASAVRAAVDQVRADPLLPGTEKSSTLRFKARDKVDEAGKPPEDSLRWWFELMRNVSGGLRVAVWLIAAALLIWVLLRLRDWLQQREPGPALAAQPPTHVGSLDIRPESLPADIGAAARALLARGETRAALSLLYRGALSRLVHGHGVPIRAASTESDCLRLAAARLDGPSQDFLTLLVGNWQAVAYARRQPSGEALERLCAGFDAALEPRP